MLIQNSLKTICRYHSCYPILNLDYGFTHLDKLLISSIVKYHGKKFSGLDDDVFFDTLKPHEERIKWLTSIISIAEALAVDRSEAKIEFLFEKNTIVIKSEKRLYLAEEKLKALLKGNGLNFRFET